MSDFFSRPHSAAVESDLPPPTRSLLCTEFSSVVPLSGPCTCTESQGISTLGLFGGHHPTIHPITAPFSPPRQHTAADLLLRHAECCCIASSPSLPPSTPSTFARARSSLLRQTAVSTAPTRLRCITFALASRIQVPACLSETDAHPTKPASLPSPQYTASSDCFPGLFEFRSRLLEGHAGHVHCGIGHLEKQRQSGQTLQRQHPSSLQ